MSMVLKNSRILIASSACIFALTTLFADVSVSVDGQTVETTSNGSATTTPVTQQYYEYPAQTYNPSTYYEPQWENWGWGPGSWNDNWHRGDWNRGDRIGRYNRHRTDGHHHDHHHEGHHHSHHGSHHSGGHHR